MKIIESISNKYSLATAVIVLGLGVVILKFRGMEDGTIFDSLVIETIGTYAAFMLVLLPQRLILKHIKTQYERQNADLASKLIRFRIKELNGEKLTPNEEADRILIDRQMRKLNFDFNQPLPDIDKQARELLKEIKEKFSF